MQVLQLDGRPAFLFVGNRELVSALSPLRALSWVLAFSLPLQPAAVGTALRVIRVRYVLDQCQEYRRRLGRPVRWPARGGVAGGGQPGHHVCLCQAAKRREGRSAAFWRGFGVQGLRRGVYPGDAALGSLGEGHARFALVPARPRSWPGLPNT